MNWTLSQIRTISLWKILKTKQRDKKMHKESCNTRIMWIAQFKYKILKQTFHKRMYVYDKQALEKMFSTISHQENAI